MIKTDAWKILEQEYKVDPSDFGGTVEHKTVEEAQLLMSIKFSEDYKKFLQLYGSAIVPGHIIYGLIPLDAMGKSYKNVIDKTNFYHKQKWPDIQDWYIISDDGYGNPIGIDAKGTVWLSDHMSDFKKVKLADSFEEFLCKIFTDTLYDE